MGPNFEDSYLIAAKFKIPVIISGGISSIKDINKIISDNKKIDGITGLRDESEKNCSFVL